MAEVTTTTPLVDVPVADAAAVPAATTPATPAGKQAFATRVRGAAASVSTNPRAAAAVQRAREHTAMVSAAFDQARARANTLAEHPYAVRAQGVARQHVANARDIVGKSPTLVKAEKATGVDRLVLLFGGNLLFVLLVVYNVLGLANSITTAMCLIAPIHAAMKALENDGNIQDVDSLLVYFVFFGLVQTVESLVGGRFLEAHIPKYYTVKLAILFYLSHPNWKGASAIYKVAIKTLTSSHKSSPAKSNGGSRRSSSSNSSSAVRSPTRPDSKLDSDQSSSSTATTPVDPGSLLL